MENLGRDADYKRMYLVMVNGVENAISILSCPSEIGSHENAITALRLLIEAQRQSEEIYIRTIDDKPPFIRVVPKKDD